MRLTADLINNSLSYINPLTERELDLRGHKIPAIENLGVARDQDCIDFTDNDIAVLGNFPLSPRLRSLLLSRNRISTIQPTLARSIPNLTTIVLTQNKIAELADLEPLSSFSKLTHLVLLENPVASKEHYRLWTLHRIPSVRFLDFQKVKDEERRKAKSLFGTTSEPTELASKILSVRSRTATFDLPTHKNGTQSTTSNVSRIKLTAAEKKHVEGLIRNAKTFAEMERLEKMLNEGKVPGGIISDADAMEE